MDVRVEVKDSSYREGGRMACGGDVRTSAGGVVVGGMMLLVAKRIMANSFPGMESRVMPRWFEHTSLFPLFFQKGRMIPLRQSSGMVFLIHTMLIM